MTFLYTIEIDPEDSRKPVDTNISNQGAGYEGLNNIWHGFCSPHYRAQWKCRSIWRILIADLLIRSIARAAVEERFGEAM
jgi:hypothetical protein